jgi:hypothetical protein
MYQSMVAVMGYPSRCRVFDRATMLRNIIKRDTQDVSLSGQLCYIGQSSKEGKEQTGS